MIPDWLGAVFWLLVTLGILVTFHEFGHFWVARRFGVRVLRFSVGFGKPIWSRFDKHGTEIAIAPIPLGGYVKMLDDRDCEVPEGQEHETYNSKKIWQRMLILLAGPGFNFILAFLLYWFMFIVGKDEIYPTLDQPQGLMQQSGFQRGDRLVSINSEPILTWSDVAIALRLYGIDRADIDIVVETANKTQHVRRLSLSQLAENIEESEIIDAIGVQPWQPFIEPVIGEVSANLPASKAGLLAGDEIVSINQTSVDNWSQVAAILSQADIEPIQISVLRDGQKKTFSISERVESKDNPEIKIVGIASIDMAESEKNLARNIAYSLSYGPLTALGKASAETWKMTAVSLKMMWKLVIGKASIKNISGPITIARVANTSAKRGFSWFLSFLALVSLSLGIINLMPIPMLDGGQMLFLFFEKIKGAPLSENFQIKAHLVGLLLIVSLMVVAFYNDILRSVS